MKTFNIYEPPSGHVDAVKQGWSWPGFFFTVIWCLVSGLYGLGAGLFIAFVIANILSLQSEGMSALTWLAGLGVSTWIGMSGNEMRGKKLQENGYNLAGTVSAHSPEEAAAEFEKKRSHLASLGDVSEKEKEPLIDKPPWQCTNCDEEIEGQFDTCWNCGADRSS